MSDINRRLVILLFPLACCIATSYTNAQVRIIPVVVHVLHNTSEKEDPDNPNEPDDPQNISDAQILTQINVLNEDFRQLPGTPGKSDNSHAADVELEFRLADTDPDGHLTSGITRTETDVDVFKLGDLRPMHSSQGGADAWDPSMYLNIWVCNTFSRSFSSNTEGYAFFPISMNSELSAPSADEYGVVVDYKHFGDNIGAVTDAAPFSSADLHNLGDDCTHEIGHYLGLFHTFMRQAFQSTNGCEDTPCEGDDGRNDQVCDTPPVVFQSGTSECGDYPAGITCTNLLEPLQRLIRNYMDYACDGIRNLFTVGQKIRIQHFLSTDDVLSTVPNSDGFQNSTKDFILFGDHDNNKRMDASRDDISLREYDYNSTAPIVTVSSSPYSPMTVRGVSAALYDEREEGVIANMRSRSEVHLQDGFFAESHCEFQAWIDDALPDPPSKRITPRNDPQTVVSIIKDILLYPNPTSGSLGVKLSFSVAAQADLSVYNVLGNHIETLLLGAECNAGDNTFSFNLSHLAPGTYYARLRAGNSLLTKKFVVVR